MIDSIHSIRLLSHIPRSAYITKECSALSESVLSEKLQYSISKTIEHLSTLDIFPSRIIIQENPYFYILEDGKVATKVSLEMDYYSFLNNNIASKNNIEKTIKDENNKKHFLHDKPFKCKGHFYHKDAKLTDLNITANVTASSKEELLENLKHSVWGLLEKFSIGEHPCINININGLRCTQTPFGYEAHYVYSISDVIEEKEQKKTLEQKLRETKIRNQEYEDLEP